MVVAVLYLGFADRATEGMCIARMNAAFQATTRDAERLNGNIDRKKRAKNSIEKLKQGAEKKRSKAKIKSRIRL